MSVFCFHVDMTLLGHAHNVAWFDCIFSLATAHVVYYNCKFVQGTFECFVWFGIGASANRYFSSSFIAFISSLTSAMTFKVVIPIIMVRNILLNFDAFIG